MAVHVSVCIFLQDISHAKLLEDQTWEATLKRIPANLKEKCEAIHQRGPAPPPPGTHRHP